MSDTAHDTDVDLVTRCRRGEGAAWSALVHRYQRLVYAIVRRAGLDEHGAADVFQTVFVRLIEQLPRIADPSRLQAWIVTTARREAILQSRRGRRHVSLTNEGDDASEGVLADLADEAPQAEAVLIELQDRHRVRVALERMDARCRELLTLLFADDEERQPYEDIARRLDMPLGSIGPTRARCLGKLRTLIE